MVARGKRRRFHILEFGQHPPTNVPLYAFKIPYGNWERRNLQPVFFFPIALSICPGNLCTSKESRALPARPGLTLPQPASFQLRLNDPDDQKVWEKQVALSPQGTFTADIALPDGRLGNYTVVADFGQNTTRALSVDVQEYKPAPFTIALTAKDSYPADEVVRANVAANYFHGKPLAHALLRWSIEGSDTGFRPKGFDQFSFGPEGERQRGRRGAGHANSRPRASCISPTTARPKSRRKFRPIPPSRSRAVQPAGGNHRPRPDHDFRAARDSLGKAPLFISASSGPMIVIVAGKPFPDQPRRGPGRRDAAHRAGQARVVIEKRNFHTVREEGAGGALNYRTETQFASVFDQSVPALPLQKSDERWEIAAAANASRFTPNEVGSYRLRALSKDEAGHPIETGFNFSVSAEEPRKTDWDYRNEAQFDLVPDKSSYAPGEEAKILVKTPINGAALVTIEQDRVRRAFVTKLEGNAPVVRVPLEATDAPNVFVSVLALRGRAQSPRQIKAPDYRVGYAQLNVVKPEARLAVAFESNRALLPSGRGSRDHRAREILRRPAGGERRGRALRRRRRRARPHGLQSARSRTPSSTRPNRSGSRPASACRIFFPKTPRP